MYFSNFTFSLFVISFKLYLIKKLTLAGST